MKHILRFTSLILLGVMFGINSYAQSNSGTNPECIYKYVVSSTDKAGSKVEGNYFGVLQMTPVHSRFIDYSAYAVDSAQVCKAPAGEIKTLSEKEFKNTHYFTPVIYNIAKDKKLTVYDYIGLDLCKYSEELPIVKWESVDGSMDVCGYKCAKAVGSYAGRRWTVWYTPDIPLPYGPWKLIGLPGLVLKATDADGIHTFEAISIRNTAVPCVSRDARDATGTSRDKFIATRNKFMESPMSNIPQESIKEISVLKNGDEKTLIINGVPLRNFDGTYIPLELK
ncbi:GLPGLI family protein [Porphyromonas pogonae]|uniref:GLPGLI family protein n=1 Tax=Porphyromonas pogonae TaxID=867595 RepID=UPI002E75D42F|nr:GLPGLI family protein [Porphyromonas pogonae]